MKMASKKFNVTYGIDQRVEEDDDRMRILMEQLIQESLCSNCKHQGDCVFLQKACTSIVECELYECGLSEKPSLRVVKKKPVRPPTSSRKAARLRWAYASTART
jgi:hypothetical protein